jgi:hypothetical protein
MALSRVLGSVFYLTMLKLVVPFFYLTVSVLYRTEMGIPDCLI